MCFNYLFDCQLGLIFESRLSNYGKWLKSCRVISTYLLKIFVASSDSISAMWAAAFAILAIL